MNELLNKLTKVKGGPPIKGDWFYDESPYHIVIMVSDDRGWWINQHDLTIGILQSFWRGWILNEQNYIADAINTYGGNIFNCVWED